MPYLVARTGEGTTGGIWEVKWTWMPYFLAADRELHKKVDQTMNRLFQGGDGSELMEKTMSSTVIRTILEHYPMPGLEEALRALEKVEPEERVRLEVVEPITQISSSQQTTSSQPSEEEKA